MYFHGTERAELQNPPFHYISLDNKHLNDYIEFTNFSFCLSQVGVKSRDSYLGVFIYKGMNKKKIVIADFKLRRISWESLEDFQADLKTITPESLEKLKHSIINYSFVKPVFVWMGHKFILDGHSRIKALRELVKEGFEVPPKINVLEVPASSKNRAKELVIVYTTQHGNVRPQGLYDYIKPLNTDRIGNTARLLGNAAFERILGGMQNKPFTPTVPQGQSEKIVTSEEYESEEARVNERLKNMTAKQLEVTCPNCAHDFSISNHIGFGEKKK